MNGPEMAVRYADHEAIESLKAARGYNDKAERLKHQAYTPEELGQITKDAEAIAANYEPDYDSEYGWAAKALKKKKPNFADIEKAVGFFGKMVRRWGAQQSSPGNRNGVLGY
jgi:hypothetical protein